MAIEHLYELNAILPPDYNPPYPAQKNANLNSPSSSAYYIAVFVPTLCVDKESGKEEVGLLPAGVVHSWLHPELWGEIPTGHDWGEFWHKVFSYFEQFSHEKKIPLRVQLVRSTRRLLIFYQDDVYLSTEGLYPPIPDIWGYPAEIRGRGKYGDVKIYFRQGLGIVTKHGYKSAPTTTYLPPSHCETTREGDEGFIILSPEGKPKFFVGCKDIFDAVYRLDAIVRIVQLLQTFGGR